MALFVILPFVGFWLGLVLESERSLTTREYAERCIAAGGALNNLTNECWLENGEVLPGAPHAKLYTVAECKKSGGHVAWMDPRFGGIGFYLGHISDPQREVEVMLSCAQLCSPHDACCAASLLSAEEGGYRIIGADVTACPEGFVRDGMKCESSLSWCRPVADQTTARTEGSCLPLFTAEESMELTAGQSYAGYCHEASTPAACARVDVYDVRQHSFGSPDGTTDCSWVDAEMSRMADLVDMPVIAGMYPLFIKRASWGPCPTSDTCFQGVVLLNTGRVERETYTGVEVVEGGVSLVDSYRSYVNEHQLLSKECSAEVVLDLSKTYYLYGRTEPIRFPGCADELVGLDKMLETALRGATVR